MSNVNAIIPYERVVADNQRAAKEDDSYNQKIQSFLSKWNKVLPGSLETEKKLGFFDILNESIDLMQDKLTSLLMEKHQPDLVINTSRDACSTFEFYKAEEMINAGKIAYDKCKKSK